ncbi:MAG: toll/interleukin-1 receptor domain-containing protein [Bacteroidota bacterium]
MKIFISYSWDSEAHKSWVLNLANSLIKNGIDVLLDQYELRLGRNLNHFMESSVNEADKIITVFTENYKLRSENRAGGIGYEYSMITSELYKNQIENTKVLPILKSGSPEESIPLFMTSFVWLDMRNDHEFESNLELLIRELYDEREIRKPELGAKPLFTTQKQVNNYSAFNWKAKVPKYIESFDFDHPETDPFEDYSDGIWTGEKGDGVFVLRNGIDENEVKYHHIRYDGALMSNYATSVEIQLKGNATPKSSGGLLFCFNERLRTYYSFTVNNTGQCRLWLRSTEGFTPILSERSKLIRQDDFNTLGCIVDNASIHLFINDQLFKVVQEDSPGDGDAGIIAMGRGEFVFDNLSFYEK